MPVALPTHLRLREVVLNDADEDALTAAILTEWPDAYVLPANRFRERSIPIMSSIAEARAWHEARRVYRFQSHNAIIVLPYPGWTPKLEAQPDKYGDWQLVDFPPWYIYYQTFRTDREPPPSWSPKPCEFLVAGSLQMGWSEDRPTVDIEKAAVRKVWRMIGRFCTNKLQLIDYKTGEPSQDEPADDLWVGNNAIRWAREHPWRGFLLRSARTPTRFLRPRPQQG